MNEKLTVQVTKFTLITLIKNSVCASHKTQCDYIFFGILLPVHLSTFIKINVLYSANHTELIILTQLLGKKKKKQFLTKYDRQPTW